MLLPITGCTNIHFLRELRNYRKKKMTTGNMKFNTSRAALLHQLYRARIPLSRVEGIQRFGKNVIRRDQVEERHRRSELECINAAARNLVDVFALMRQYGIRYLQKTLSKDWMGKVFPCLIQIPDAIELSIGAMPQPFYLGKDVPNPMVHLPSLHHFSQCGICLLPCQVYDFREVVQDLSCGTSYPDLLSTDFFGPV